MATPYLPNAYTPAYVIQGPADVYVNVQPPVSASPPVQGTNTWCLASGGGTYTIDADGEPMDNGKVAAAPSAPTATGTGSGSLSGVFYVKVTYTTAFGETLPSNETTTSSLTSQNLKVTSPIASSPATGYNVYVSATTGEELLQTPSPVAIGTDTTLVAIATDTAVPPTLNTTGGFHIGLSDGPVTLHTTPKFLEIRADQPAAAVDAAFTSLETEIDIVVKEALLQNLRPFFSSTLGTYTAVAAGSTNPACDFLQIGSVSTCATLFNSILLVSPDKSNLGHFYIVNLYKALLMSAVETTFHRTTISEWKLKFRGIADTNRVMGDLVAQIVKA
jgi:hypothetical protein